MRVSQRQLANQGQLNGFRSSAVQFITVKPGETVQVTMGSHAYGFAVDPTTRTALLNVGGVKWDSGSDSEGHTDSVQRIDSSMNGVTYRICMDESCPPLTPDELTSAKRLVQSMVEGVYVEGPPIGRQLAAKAEPSSVWWHIVTDIGRDGTDDEIVRRTKDMINAGMTRDMTTHWGPLYDKHPRQKTVQPGAATAADVVAGGVYTVEVYHRALDRCPGGNENNHIVKHKYTSNLNGPGGRDHPLALAASLTALHWYEFDVSMFITPEPITRNATVTEQFESAVVAPLIAAFEGDPVYGRDVVCTIDDPREDCEQVDTEWSSIEVMLFDSSGQLISRIHRRARLINDRYVPIAMMPPEAQAPPPVQAVLDGVQSVLGVGTVKGWYDNDADTALGNYKLHRWDYLGSVTPIYFGDPFAKTPARVTTGTASGTPEDET
ncbi:unnamed protein product [Heterosigma akashiwo]